VNIQAEVSLYPLRTPHLSKPINEFCEALMKSGLHVDIGSMSAFPSGEVDQVFNGLKSALVEIGRDHEVVLVLKASNACPAGSVSEQGQKRGS